MSRYSAKLMEHFLAPRNAESIDAPAFIGRADIHGSAPRLSFYIAIADDVVQRAGFKAFGCGVTIAAGSALTEMVTGRSVAECQSLSASDVINALDGIPPQKAFCADLAIRAMHDALEKAGFMK